MIATREIATLKHARRQLRENYLSDAPGNAANEWFGIFHSETAFDWLASRDVEAADHVVADVVESALWSARAAKVGPR